jgi:hypothetical protein
MIPPSLVSSAANEDEPVQRQGPTAIARWLATATVVELEALADELPASIMGDVGALRDRVGAPRPEQEAAEQCERLIDACDAMMSAVEALPGALRRYPAGLLETIGEAIRSGDLVLDDLPWRLADAIGRPADFAEKDVLRFLEGVGPDAMIIEAFQVLLGLPIPPRCPRRSRR